MAHVNKPSDAGNAWIAYWQNRPLPILDASKKSMQQMLRRTDRLQADEVAAVVLGDPLLTLQALRFMSQRPRSSMSAEVVSIQSIIMLMGTTPFLERFSDLPTVESILPPDSADYAAYLQQVFLSRLSVKLALVYADWRYDARVEEIYISALLARSNVLLELVGARQDTDTPPLEGDDRQLLIRLGIPDAITQLLGEVDNAPIRVQLQLSVLRLVAAIPYGWWQDTIQQELNFIAGILNVEVGTVWSALSTLLLQSARNSERWPQVEQPARWLPMLPGEWPGSAKAQAAAESAAQEMHQRDVLTLRMQSLHLSGQKGTQTKDIMTLAVRALAEGLQMRRIVFAMLTPGQPELRVRFVMGVPVEDPLRQLSVRMDVPHLFGKLMEKPQSLWLNEANVAQYFVHLPAVFRTSFVSQHFFAMSIFVGSKPLGLIVADRDGTEVLSEYQYQHFKQICQLTTRALTQSAAT